MIAKLTNCFLLTDFIAYGENGTLYFQNISAPSCVHVIVLEDDVYENSSEYFIFKLLSATTVDHFINESMNYTVIYIYEGMYAYRTISTSKDLLARVCINYIDIYSVISDYATIASKIAT